MSAGFLLHRPDRIKRRVMFALELVDPITGRLVPDLIVAAPGFGSPVLTPSGRYVWLDPDPDPPATRQVKIVARSKSGTFAPFEAEFETPARLPGIDPDTLRRPFELTPTGLYEPPPGITAAAGSVVVAHADRTPLTNVAITLQFADTRPDAPPITCRYKGKTDSRGQFVTVVPLSTVLDTAARADGRLKAWLKLSGQVDGSQAERFAALKGLRQGRLVRIREPLEWDTLSHTAP